IGLLVVTGMRSGEAVRLDRGDVDLVAGRVSIIATKFNKSRVLALQPTTVQALEGYGRLRDRRWPRPATVGFFVSSTGRRLSQSSLEQTFAELVRRARPAPRRPGAAAGVVGPTRPRRSSLHVLVLNGRPGTVGPREPADPSREGGLAMTALAPTLQAFFVSRLGRQRDASPHTVDSYRHAFRLLLAYAEAQTGKRPSRMDLADLDAVLVSGFLDHLEDDRGSSVASRNTRLAAVHSFFRFASYQHPENAETIQQGLAIPRKKTQSIPRSFLTSTEMDAVV